MKRRRCHFCGRRATLEMPCIGHCGMEPLGNDAQFFCDKHNGWMKMSHVPRLRKSAGKWMEDTVSRRER